MTPETSESIINHKKYIQDIIDLNEYVLEKVKIYDKAAEACNSALIKYHASKHTDKDIEACRLLINSVWDKSSKEIKNLIFKKPYGAGSAVDHFFESKKILGDCENVRKDEGELLTALSGYMKELDKIYKKWTEGGSERKKMMSFYNFCSRQDTKSLDLFRKLDYLADAALGDTIKLYRDDYYVSELL